MPSTLPDTATDDASPAESTEVKPILTSDNCHQKLPAWGVTRQFEFGQFVILYDEKVVKGKRVVNPVVLTDEGDIFTSGKSNAMPSSQNQPLSFVTGGVPIHLLYETEKAVELVTNQKPKEVQINNIKDFLQSGEIALGDTTYRASLTPQAKMNLASGHTITVLGHAEQNDSKERRALFRLVPRIQEITLSREELNHFLSSGEIKSTGLQSNSYKSPQIAEKVLAGREVIVTFDDDDGITKLCKLKPDIEKQRPASTQFQIQNLANFISRPMILDKDFLPMQVNLTTNNIEDLRTEGRTVVKAGAVDIEVGVENWRSVEVLRKRLSHDLDSTIGSSYDPDVPPNGPPSFDPTNLDLLPPLENGNAFETVPLDRQIPGDLIRFVDGALESIQVQPLGLQIAVLLPWLQKWILNGFSRGSLISTIALAPGEESTITLSSWERRAKALEQSTETETEQQVDFTQTTRDTEDVFREMTSRHDFQAQINGSLDASYTNGVASVSIGVDGGVSNTTSLQNVLKTTENHMHEVTTKASTRVRSRRITKITESVEMGFSHNVVRRIHNANQCHTLTLDFHEVLAHYTISTSFLPSKVKVVVLIPNPISLQTFNEEIIRKNETALRNSLLDPALSEGFEACRLLTAYAFAKEELRTSYEESKRIAEMDRERVKQTKDQNGQDISKPKNPHEPTVIQLVSNIREIAKKLQTVGIKAALDAIASHSQMTEPDRQSAQRWMFVQICRSKFSPAFLDSLTSLVSAVLGVKDGKDFVAQLPDPYANPSLSTINDLSDDDKEKAGLDIKIKSYPGFLAGDWSWWTGRCREERLYRVDDLGLASKAKELKQALQDYDAKEAEGEGIQQGQNLVNNANANQTSANYLDKLEMKYGVEIVAAAMERVEALKAHLNDHLDYYRYVLFQALPPGEQLRRIMDIAPQLRVGMFEPHVVATNGPSLAIPLSPLAQSKLEKTVTGLQKTLTEASATAEETAVKMEDNKVILPTPGVTIESWLGDCSACELHIELMRETELRRAKADAEYAELQADRLDARIHAKPPLLDDPSPGAPASLRIKLEDKPEK